MASGRKGTVKLNELLRIEKAMQEKWANERTFEEDAPALGSPESQSVTMQLKDVHTLYFICDVFS